MVVISSIKDGAFSLNDHIKKTKSSNQKKDDVNIFCSSRQNFTLNIKKIKEQRYSFFLLLTFS